MNHFTTIFVLSLGVSIIIQWFLVQRHINHISSHREEVPDAFNGKISIEAHHRAADYTQAKVRKVKIQQAYL